jgi:hypothetical protein
MANKNVANDLQAENEKVGRDEGKADQPTIGKVIEIDL